MEFFATEALFDGWEGIIKILVTAPIIYLSIICSVQIFGNRSTSQMNSFDWIVTVAIGSISASGIILDNVSIAECVLAVFLLLLFQWGLTKSVIHSRSVHKLIKARPTLLVHEGEYIPEALKKERVAKEEILAALRHSGLFSIQDAQWVILETDATLSVIPRQDKDYSKATLESVQGFPPKV